MALFGSVVMVILFRDQMGLSIRGGFRQNVELFVLIFLRMSGFVVKTKCPKMLVFEKCLM